MNKYEFTNSILKDLTARLKRKNVQSRNFRLTTIESLGSANCGRQEETKQDLSSSLQMGDGKLVLTEGDVLKINEKQIILPPGSIITPLAKDAARRKGINIVIGGKRINNIDGI